MLSKRQKELLLWVIILIIIPPPLGCALALAKGNLCLSSGPMVRHNCHGITISTHPLLVTALLTSTFLSKVIKSCNKRRIPWQLCQTIGPLTFHSQHMGGDTPSIRLLNLKHMEFLVSCLYLESKLSRVVVHPTGVHK